MQAHIRELFQAGRFAEALGQLAGRGDEEARSYRGMCLFQLGRYAEALAELRDNAYNDGIPYRVEILGRILEQLELAEELRQRIGASRHPQLDFFRRSLRQAPAELEAARAVRFLGARTVAEIQATLPRRVVCHAFSGLSELREVELDLCVLGPDPRAQTAVLSALAFFQRELGPATPRFCVLPARQEEDPLRPELERYNSLGTVLRQLQRGSRRPRRLTLILRDAPECAFSGGLARSQGRICLVDLGHHEGHRGLTVAHEMAHMLLDLPDLREQPLDDPCSLMGDEWEGPPMGTYLGLRMKAACLTTARAQRWIGRGRRAERDKRFREALQAYQAAWREDPWHLALGNRLVFLLARLGGKAQAASIARALRQRYPSLEVRLALAEALREKQLPPLDGLDARRHSLVGRWYLRQGRERRAWEHLRRLPPDELEAPLVWLSRAELELARWRPDRAWPLIEQAESRAAEHYRVHELRGSCLSLLGRPRAAAAAYRKARELSGRCRVAWQELYLARAAGNRPRLRRLAEEILKRDEFDGPLWALLGLLQLRAGEEARPALRKARRYAPSSLHRAYLALAEGRRAEALRLARSALRPLEDRPQALEVLAYLEPEGEWSARLGRDYPTFYQLLCSH